MMHVIQPAWASFRVGRSSSKHQDTHVVLIGCTAYTFLNNLVSPVGLKHVAIQFRRHKALQCYTLMPENNNCSAGEMQTDSLQPEGRP